jgi:hypothetical protein
MKISEAKAAQAAIEEAARRLNAEIEGAAERGLAIEIEITEQGWITRATPTPRVRVSARIAPGDVEEG